LAPRTFTPEAYFRSFTYLKDKELLEKVQQRFTRKIPGLKDVPYNERVQILGRWSLEERRIRSDLIEVYKMINKLSNVNLRSSLNLTPTEALGVTH